ncbi:MAG: deoxyribonuclease IV [Phycisphaerae bacterium]|nr:deoxyribonuclease IV [Gemmatimonadaceae bacterium]
MTPAKKTSAPKVAQKRAPAIAKEAARKLVEKAGKNAQATIAATTVSKPAVRKAAPAVRKSVKSAPAALVKHDAGDHSLDTAPLGAHVSVAGGIWEAANRCMEISSTSSQIFTKNANRWMEREVDESESTRYRTSMQATTVRWTCAHDSYLINLASPDAELRRRSIESFRCELRRCHALGLDALVSHPGNFLDDRASGLARNVEGITEALEAEPGPTRLLMELTAGQGTVLGSTFEEMAQLLDAIPARVRSRVGVCLDTAHVWAAGYDLINDYNGVIQRFDDTIGLARLECLHLNDSKAKLGSHLDRHELIAEGTIGANPFRRIMTDARLSKIPRVIETPKGDDHAAADSRMLARLRSYAAGL